MKRNQWLQEVLTVGGIALALYKLIQLSQRTNLRDEVLLVTGASRGLGLLLVREFARQGCHVVMCARVQEELDQAQEQLREWGVTADEVVCDITDEAEVDGMIEIIMQMFGRVDTIVNNAGTIQVGPIESTTLDNFREAMDTMFWGGICTIHKLLPHMQQRGSGRIVNITSIGGKVAVPHLLPYVAAKFAMTGFSEGLAMELSGSGIQVTTIVPGLMRTGSYLNAHFQGHQAEEFSWFSLGDNLPFISIDGEVAARSIVDAVKRGDAEYILTIPAKGLTRFYGLLPNFAIRLIGLLAQIVLPAPTHNPVTERGMEIERRMQSPVFKWLTAWGRAAARDFNQYSAQAYKPPYNVEQL
jgi:short-subunit dehydrogenase